MAEERSAEPGTIRELLRAIPVFAGNLPDFDPEAAPDDPVPLFVQWLATAIGGQVVGNLLMVPFLIDVIRQYEKGVASMEAIDEVIKLGFNHPMGPFALCDLIGLDIVHDMAVSMYEETKEPRYYPTNLLKQMVRMGRLGRKTGRGFYSYD